MEVTRGREKLGPGLKVELELEGWKEREGEKGFVCVESGGRGFGIEVCGAGKSGRLGVKVGWDEGRWVDCEREDILCAGLWYGWVWSGLGGSVAEEQCGFAFL